MKKCLIAGDKSVGQASSVGSEQAEVVLDQKQGICLLDLLSVWFFIEPKFQLSEGPYPNLDQMIASNADSSLCAMRSAVDEMNLCVRAMGCAFRGVAINAGQQIKITELLTRFIKDRTEIVRGEGNLFAMSYYFLFIWMLFFIVAVIERAARGRGRGVLKTSYD